MFPTRASAWRLVTLRAPDTATAEPLFSEVVTSDEDVGDVVELLPCNGVTLNGARFSGPLPESQPTPLFTDDGTAVPWNVGAGPRPEPVSSTSGLNVVPPSRFGPIGSPPRPFVL